MKRILRKLALASICGVGAACSPGSRSESDETRQAPPPIPYCELANYPEKYDGQTVRVTANLYFMMHGYKFMDKDCLGDEKETAVILNADHEAKLAKEIGSDEYNPWSFPRIIATGK